VFFFITSTILSPQENRYWNSNLMKKGMLRLVVVGTYFNSAVYNLKKKKEKRKPAA
jgi:hypothetical protein